MLTKTTGVTAAYLCDPGRVVRFNVEALEMLLWDVEENGVIVFVFKETKMAKLKTFRSRCTRS